MGQVTSTSGYKSPVYVAQGLSINKITIQPARSENKKVIRVDALTSELKLPNSKPLSTFTQNEDSGEHPFLLNCASSDTIIVVFKLNQELLAQFDNAGTSSITVYNDLLLRAYNEKHVAVKHSPLASKLVVNNGNEKSTMDPSVIQISKDKDEFKITVHLDTIPSEGKTYITFSGGSEEIFNALIYIQRDEDEIDPSLADATYKDAPYMFDNDSPEFRKTLALLEDRCHMFRTLLKNSIKKVQTLDEATRHLALARSGFSNSLSELANHAMAIENPLMYDVISEVIPVLTEKSTADIEESNVLTRNVITPLVLIFNSDIKLLSNKRRFFYDQAKRFYLSIDEKKPLSSDTDLLKLQVNFELNRFDYYQYLNEFRNGHSIRNLLYNFTLYLESYNKKLYSPASNVNASKAQFYYKNFFKYKGSQQRMRNELATTTNIKDLPSLRPASILVTSNVPPAPLPSRSPDSSMDASIFSTENKSTLHKSGILMTLGGQNKAGWHKQQVTINDNLLTELIDWRENHETLRCNPVDLTFSCVKTVDTLRNRKYCMEIITPSNVKRLFQAESEIERLSWVQMFTSAASLKADDNQYNRPKSASDKSSSKNGKKVSVLKFEGSQQDHHDDVLDDPLSIVRGIDVSNQLCCDCGTSNSVEWISLNLLVVVCIDCSGVHRSLGSHISKIRSLSLDTKAFRTKEAQMLLYHVSNKFTNSYLEGALPIDEKITPTASDQQRLSFITNKYTRKKYLIKEDSFNANESLIKGVHSANVPLVLKALAYGGNVKMVVIKDVHGEKKEATLFEYSLTHCHGEPGEPVFDVSHLLHLNNAPVGDKVAPVLSLNDDQKRFWRRKVISTPFASPVGAVSQGKKSPTEVKSPSSAVKKLPDFSERDSFDSAAVDSQLEKKRSLPRSHSMLLKRNSTVKTNNSEAHKSVDMTRDKSVRASRFKMLSFKSS